MLVSGSPTALLDDSGVGLTLQLTYFVEAYIKKYTDTGAFQPPQASQMQAQVNALVGAYGSMERPSKARQRRRLAGGKWAGGKERPSSTRAGRGFR